MKKRYLGRKSKKRTVLMINGPRNAPMYQKISRLRKIRLTSFLYSFAEKECKVVSTVPKPILNKIITIINTI